MKFLRFCAKVLLWPLKRLFRKRLRIILLRVKDYGDLDVETLQVGGLFTLVASELDAKGNVLSGSELVALTWVSSDPTILSLAVHPGAQSCDVTAAGKVGTATVTASAGAVSSLPFSGSVTTGPLASITLSVVTPVAASAAAGS